MNPESEVSCELCGISVAGVTRYSDIERILYLSGYSSIGRASKFLEVIYLGMPTEPQ